MRILLINYAMDDNSPVLAGAAGIARALASKAESVHVLTEQLGPHQGALNMTVDVIPRWPCGVPKRFGGGFFVNFQLWRLLKKQQCDVCFIHMAHTWAYRLAPALSGMPVLLWYAHSSVNLSLRLAVLFSTAVVSANQESFRLPTKKAQFIGAAINIGLFQIPAQRLLEPEILYIGRISARKRVLLMLETLVQLRQQEPNIPWRLKLVGPTLTAEDKTYIAEVDSFILAHGLSSAVQQTGPLSLAELPALYTAPFLHLNLSETGSMDKSVMEALAAGCPVLTTNIAFKETLKDEVGMFSSSENPANLAAAIVALYHRRHRINPESLRAIVTKDHDLNSFGEKIIEKLEQLKH